VIGYEIIIRGTARVGLGGQQEFGRAGGGEVALLTKIPE
jgi:hypothetical protein